MSHECFMVRKACGLESGVYMSEEGRQEAFQPMLQLLAVAHFTECDVCGGRSPDDKTLQSLVLHLLGCSACSDLVGVLSCDVCDEIRAARDPGLFHRLSAELHRMRCPAHHEDTVFEVAGRLFTGFSLERPSVEKLPRDDVALGQQILEYSLALQAAQDEFRSGRLMVRFLRGEKVDLILDAQIDIRNRMLGMLLLAEACLAKGDADEGLVWARRALELGPSTRPHPDGGPDLTGLVRLLAVHDTALAVGLTRLGTGELEAIQEALIAAGRTSSALELPSEGLSLNLARLAVNRERPAVESYLEAGGVTDTRNTELVQALLEFDLSRGESASLARLGSALVVHGICSRQFLSLASSCATTKIRRLVWRFAFRAARHWRESELKAAKEIDRRFVMRWAEQLFEIADIAAYLGDLNVAAALARLAGRAWLLEHPTHPEGWEIRVTARAYAFLSRCAGRVPSWWPRSPELAEAAKDALPRVGRLPRGWQEAQKLLPGRELGEIPFDRLGSLVTEGRLEEAWAMAPTFMSGSTIGCGDTLPPPRGWFGPPSMRTGSRKLYNGCQMFTMKSAPGSWRNFMFATNSCGSWAWHWCDAVESRRHSRFKKILTRGAGGSSTINLLASSSNR